MISSCQRCVNAGNWNFAIRLQMIEFILLKFYDFYLTDEIMKPITLGQ